MRNETGNLVLDAVLLSASSTALGFGLFLRYHQAVLAVVPGCSLYVLGLILLAVAFFLFSITRRTRRLSDINRSVLKSAIEVQQKELNNGPPRS